MAQPPLLPILHPNFLNMKQKALHNLLYFPLGSFLSIDLPAYYAPCTLNFFQMLKCIMFFSQSAWKIFCNIHNYKNNIINKPSLSLFCIFKLACLLRFIPNQYSYHFCSHYADTCRAVKILNCQTHTFPAQVKQVSHTVNKCPFTINLVPFFLFCISVPFYWWCHCLKWSPSVSAKKGCLVLLSQKGCDVPFREYTCQISSIQT